MSSIKHNLSVWDIDVIDKTNYELLVAYFTIECLASLQFHLAHILKKNKQKYDFIEKTVYDLSKFYLKNANKDIYNENIEIEFWFKTSATYGKNMHTDGDDNANSTRKIAPSPIMSILLYFNENDNPTMITNIDTDSYKYKQFQNENKNICFIFPKTMKSIVFDGSYYHSEIDIFGKKNELRNILVIDIWENYIPLKLNHYECTKYSHLSYNIDDPFINIHRNTIINTISRNDAIITDEFFNDILYKSRVDSYKKLAYAFESNDIQLYDGFFLMNNETLPHSESIDLPTNKVLEKMPFSLHNIMKWNEYINIIPAFLDTNQINYLLHNFTKYGELDKTDPLFEYILKNISKNVCDKLVAQYSLDTTYKITIQQLNISNHITTDFNNTIIASIALKPDHIYKKENDEEQIVIHPGFLIFQNDDYINKDTYQIFIEFIIDVQQVL
jgi:hypothetical protein